LDELLKVQEIRELIKLIDKSTITEFEYEEDGARVTLKKELQSAEVVSQAPVIQQAPVQQPVAEVVTAPAQPEVNQPTTSEKPATTSDANLHKIESPMVGTFYSSPSPDADVYVKVGDKISKDSVVCIVEAMKLFNEIEAEVNGEIVEVLVENGQLVEYGQPLFLVKAD
jgi:acetyl-CoA carboxylase biotin carboxyl carrier protein